MITQNEAAEEFGITERAALARSPTLDLLVIERFTRMDDHALLYRFTIGDPQTWTKPWTREYSLESTLDNLGRWATQIPSSSLASLLVSARRTLTKLKVRPYIACFRPFFACIV